LHVWFGFVYSIICNVSGFQLEFTGYGSAPTMPQMMPPPGAPQIPGQLNSLPRPPSLAPPPTAPGSTAPPPSNGAPSMASSAMYQANAPAPSSGGYDNYNSNSNAQAPEGNH
jgi:U1 small nuclear ribonucleoprotein C